MKLPMFKNKVTIVVIAGVLLASATTAGALMVVNKDTVTQKNASTNSAPQETDTPEPTPTPASSQEPISNVSPEPTVTATPTPSQTPIVYKWASEMAAAGIASGDYGYVTEMVLDDNGWRMDINTKLWQKATTVGNNGSNLTGKIGTVNNWVKTYYNGNWTTAHDSWVNRGNF